MYKNQNDENKNYFACAHIFFRMQTDAKERRKRKYKTNDWKNFIWNDRR